MFQVRPIELLLCVVVFQLMEWGVRWSDFLSISRLGSGFPSPMYLVGMLVLVLSWISWFSD